jgi:hypothetical protein
MIKSCYGVDVLVLLEEDHKFVYWMPQVDEVVVDERGVEGSVTGEDQARKHGNDGNKAAHVVTAQGRTWSHNHHRSIRGCKCHLTLCASVVLITQLLFDISVGFMIKMLKMVRWPRAIVEVVVHINLQGFRSLGFQSSGFRSPGFRIKMISKFKAMCTSALCKSWPWLINHLYLGLIQILMGCALGPTVGGCFLSNSQLSVVHKSWLLAQWVVELLPSQRRGHILSFCRDKNLGSCELVVLTRWWAMANEPAPLRFDSHTRVQNVLAHELLVSLLSLGVPHEPQIIVNLY